MPQRDAIPRQFSTARAADLRNKVIVGGLIVMALCGPIALGVSLSASGTARTAAATVDGIDDPIHRVFAEAAAARWAFGGDNLPTSQGFEDYGRPVFTRAQAEELGLNPDLVDNVTDLGVRHLVWVEATFTQLSNNRVGELHRFLVISQSGMFWLTVPITEIPEDEHTSPSPALGGSPTLHPYVVHPELEAVTPIEWENDTYPTVEVAGEVEARIAEWAEAYAADNASELYDITADDRRVTYRGLGGFRLLDSRTRAAALHPEREGMMMVAVELVLGTTRGVVVRADYDLLVAEIDTPRPFIVSWGARGSGPNLEPWEHAVITDSTGAGGFMPARDVEAPAPTDDNGSDTATAELDAEALLRDLQAGTQESLRAALDPDSFDTGQIALLAESIENAPDATLTLDGNPDLASDTRGLANVNATVAGESGRMIVRFEVRDINGTPQWRITQLEQRQAPEHPLTTGEPAR